MHVRHEIKFEGIVKQSISPEILSWSNYAHEVHAHKFMLYYDEKSTPETMRFEQEPNIYMSIFDF